MWYHVSVPVPAGTPEDQPVEKVIQLTHGVVTYLAVGFPAGCKQLVSCRVYHWEHQIFPTNPDEAACWNGGIEGGTEHYVLDMEPFDLIVRAYAPNATKDHTLTVFVNLLPLEIAEPWQGTQTAIDKIKSLFGLR